MMRRSITELCRADHRDDEDDLRAWLATKTAAAVAAWIDQAEGFCVTALGDDEDIAGFGMILRPGILKLLYVSPDHAGTGVGKTMLTALESRAREWRLKQLSLQSTKTAVGFYEAHGYRRADHIICRADGLDCQAMFKRLDGG